MDKLTLPNGIKHGGVLYNQVELQEMAGKQQNYLVNTKYKSNIDHLKPIILDLVHSLQSEDGVDLFKELNKEKVLVDTMPVDDIHFILAKLREISFGNEFFFDKEECSHCEYKGNYEILLGSLDVIKEEFGKDELTLPKSGKVVKFRPITLRWLQNHAANLDKMINTLVTSAMLAVIESIEGEQATKEMVENLSVLDLQAINKNTPKYNHLDLSITHTCSECGKDFDVELEVMGLDFFVLSRA